MFEKWAFLVPIKWAVLTLAIVEMGRLKKSRFDPISLEGIHASKASGLKRNYLEL